MRALLLVGLGGALGALARYGLMGAFYALFALPPRFPAATLLVNTLACFVLGLILGLMELKGWFGSSSRLFLVIGFLGAFSTYSTYAGETYALLRALEWWLAAFNIVAHTALGLVGVWLGMICAQLLA